MNDPSHPDKEAKPFLDHLEDLRWMLIKMIGTLGAAMILSFFFASELMGVMIRPLARVTDNPQDFLRTLQQEIILLNTRDPLPEVPTLNGFKVTRNNPHELEVEVPRERDLNELFSSLSAVGIHVTSVRNETSRLEELFFNLLENKGASTRDNQV